MPTCPHRASRKWPYSQDAFLATLVAMLKAHRIAADTASSDKASLAEARDVGCGTILPVRSSALGAIYRYDYNAANSPRRVDDKIFDLNCVLITTRGHWRVNGKNGATDVDETRVVTGAVGEGYGCRHGAGGNSSYIAVLGNAALDPECGSIFSRQTIPSGQALRLVERAIASMSDDAFDSLVFALFEQASLASGGSSGGAPSGLRMQRVKRFIELHAFEQIALREVASEAGLSPFTLVRQFHSAIGKSPYAYMLELRLARAKELLRTSDRPIRAVAERVGFRDPAYFSRLFANAVGCPPTVFRADRNLARNSAR
jgi:AraC-like DNA-binding protein